MVDLALCITALRRALVATAFHLRMYCSSLYIRSKGNKPEPIDATSLIQFRPVAAEVFGLES